MRIANGTWNAESYTTASESSASSSSQPDADAQSRDSHGRYELESVADDEGETSDLVLDLAAWLSFKHRFNLSSHRWAFPFPIRDFTFAQPSP